MSKFTINGEDLKEFLAQKAEIVLTGEYGMGSHREVRYNARYHSYDVYDHGEQITSSQLADDAARAFNSIQPR